VKRIALLAAALLFTLLLAACAKKNIENKDAIRQAVVEYLNARQAQTGLDMSTMDVNVTAMAFERDTARATVEFRVKGGDAGMQLNYTLDRKGDKWVVQARQDGGQGHGVVLPPSGSGTPDPGAALPPGHPSVPATPPASPKQ
jgi:outer membrane murein-binding lipoprotein Lpp